MIITRTMSIIHKLYSSVLFLLLLSRIVISMVVNKETWIVVDTFIDLSPLSQQTNNNCVIYNNSSVITSIDTSLSTNCTLRSAWNICQSIFYDEMMLDRKDQEEVVNKCVIYFLPPTVESNNSIIWQNTTLGPLIHSYPGTIHIQGNGLIVQSMNDFDTSTLQVDMDTSKPSLLNKYLLQDWSPEQSTQFIVILPSSENKIMSGTNSSRSIEECRLSLLIDNMTISSFGDLSMIGGAMMIADSNVNAPLYVSLNDVYFENNAAMYGGAIAIIVDHSTGKTDGFKIIDNMNQESLQLVMNSVTFNNHIAHLEGGSIYCALIHSRYKGHLARQSVMIKGNKVEIDRSQARNGGGIALHSTSTNAIVPPVYIQGFSFAQVDAQYGGSLYGNRVQNVTCNDMTVEDSSANLDGGVAYFNQSMFITLQDLSVKFSSAGSSGGIYVDKCDYFKGERIHMFGVGAEISGGGIFMTNSFYSKLEDIVIIGSHAWVCAGILLDSSAVTTWNLIKIENGVSTSPIAAGGSICIIRSEELSVAQLHISKGVAHQHGGGLYVSQSKLLTMIDSIIENCITSNGNGGGMYFNQRNDYLTFVNVTTRNNAATSGNGGGIYVSSLTNYIHWLDHASYYNQQIFESLNEYIVSKIFVFPSDTKQIIIYFDGDMSNDGTSFQTWSTLEIHNMTVGDPSNLNNNIVQGILLYSLDGSSTLPGLDTAPLVITDVTSLKIFYSTEIETYVKIVMIPVNTLPDVFVDVVANDTITPLSSDTNVAGACVTIGNTAGKDGGGIELAFSNQAFIMVNHWISNNVAETGHGGGLMLQSSNSRSLITASSFEKNVAGEGNGGGIYMGFGHSAVLIHSSLFVTNDVRNGQGGGLYLFSSNGYGGLESSDDAIVCINDYFIQNHAGGDGGGIHLDQRNSFQLKQSTLINNAVLPLRAISPSRIDTGVPAIPMDIESPSIEQDSGSASFYTTGSTIGAVGGGGGISIGSKNEVYLVNVDMQGNQASGKCGGGLAIIGNEASLTMEEVTVMYGIAQNGAGICVTETTAKLHIIKNLVVSNNIAGDAGGGILLANTLMWTTESFAFGLTKIEIYANQAGRGSAMFFYAIKPSRSSYSVGNITIAQNRVKASKSFGTINNEGTTIYWIYQNPGMMDQPFRFMDNRLIDTLPTENDYFTVQLFEDIAGTWGEIHWSNNQAVAHIGTQAISLSVPDEIQLIHYGSSINPPIEVRASNYYNRYVGSSQIMVDIAEHRCLEVTRPYLSGRSVNSLSSENQMKGGYLALTDLRAYCFPEGNISLRIYTNTNPLPTSLALGSSFSSSCSSSFNLGGGTNSFSLSTTSLLKFRACVAGEFIEDGNCVMCPNGTYSLTAIKAGVSSEHTSQSAVCRSCNGVEGVKHCYGNVLELQEGYWRRYATSHSVMKCFVGGISCRGGPTTGDSLCKEGYRGPFCAACQDDYHMVDGKCLSCEYQNVRDETQIVSIVVLCVLVLLVIYSFYRQYNRSFEEYQRKKQQERQLEKERQGLSKIEHTSLWSFNAILSWIENAFVDIMVKIKIIVATYQVVISAGQVFDITIPESYASFGRFFSFLNLNLSSLIPVSCLFHLDFIHRLIWATVAPFLLLLVILIIMICRFFFSWKLHYTTSMATSTQRCIVIKKMFYHYLQYIFYITYLVLPSITTMVFQLFQCQSIDPLKEDSNEYDSYLTVDVTISCTSTYYRSWLWYGYLMIIVYPIGIPCFYLICLYQNRQDIINRDLLSSSNAVDTNVEKEITDHNEEHRLESIGSKDALDNISSVTQLARPQSEDNHMIQQLTSEDEKEKAIRAFYESFYTKSPSIDPIHAQVSREGISSKSNNRWSKRSNVSAIAAIAAANTKVQQSLHPLPPMQRPPLPPRPPQLKKVPSTSDSEKYQLSIPSILSNISPFSSKDEGDVSSSVSTINPTNFPPHRPMLLRRMPTKMEFEKKMNETALNMSFLWEAYKPEFWYWELVETTRRILLTAVLSIYATGSTKQTIVGIFLAYIFNKVYAYYQPYCIYSDYRLAEIGQIQIFLTYLIMLMLSIHVVLFNPLYWYHVIGILLVMINVIIVFMGFYYEIVRYWEDHEFHERLRKLHHSMMKSFFFQPSTRDIGGGVSNGGVSSGGGSDSIGHVSSSYDGGEKGGIPSIDDTHPDPPNNNVLGSTSVDSGIQNCSFVSDNPMKQSAESSDIGGSIDSSFFLKYHDDTLDPNNNTRDGNDRDSVAMEDIVVDQAAHSVDDIEMMNVIIPIANSISKDNDNCEGKQEILSSNVKDA